MPGASGKGKVSLEKGKYYLEAEGERRELQAGMGIDEAQLKALAGQEVEVLYSEPRRFVVGLVAGRRPPIVCYLPPWPSWPGPLCYLPVEWLIKGVEKDVRVNLARRFLKDGVIGQEVYDKLI